MTSSFDPEVRPLIRSIFDELADIETEFKKLDSEILEQSLWVKFFHENIADLMSKWIDEDVKIDSNSLSGWIADLPGRTSILTAAYFRKIPVDEKLELQIEEKIDSKISNVKKNVQSLIKILEERQKPTGKIERVLLEMVKKLEPFVKKSERLPLSISRSQSQIIDQVTSQLFILKKILDGNYLLDQKEIESQLKTILRLPNSVFEERIFTTDGPMFEKFVVDNEEYKQIMKKLDEENIREFLIGKWTELEQLFKEKTNIGRELTAKRKTSHLIPIGISIPDKKYLGNSLLGFRMADEMMKTPEGIRHYMRTINASFGFPDSIDQENLSAKKPMSKPVSPLCSNIGCNIKAKYRAKGYKNLFYCSDECLREHFNSK